MKAKAMTLDAMERTMAQERAIFMRSQSEKIALRAIDFRGLMVCREFDKTCELGAMEMAKNYWLKKFLYVEVFSRNGEELFLHYHAVRTC